MKGGDDDGYSDATMVMTEHLQGDQVVEGGEVESGPVEQEHDVETPHEQIEGEQVGLFGILMKHAYT